jgi:hypothetical protein
MKYMLLMYSSEAQVAQIKPEEQQALAQAWYGLLQEATAAGVLLGSNGLLSVSDATTVRVRDGKTLTTDGPFAETHEQLGGYFVLNCQDLDEAIAWAAKVPHAQYGSVEIRPLWSEGAGQ